MKCRIKQDTRPLIRVAKDMSHGEMGVIVNDPIYNGQVVFRTFLGLVSLSNPGGDWDDDCTLEVSIFPPGTIVELEAE